LTGPISTDVGTRRIARETAGNDHDVFEEHLQNIAEQLARDLQRSVTWPTGC
jgi:hypothetical protein